MKLGILAAMILLNVMHGPCFAKTTKKDICNVASAYTKKNKIVCLCVPKSGTFLLTKCLSLLGDPTLATNYTVWNVTHRAKIVRELNKQLPPRHFKGDFHIPTVGQAQSKFSSILLRSKMRVFGWHTPYTKEYDAFLDTHVQAKFLMLRDPRAMLVSFAHMVSKGFEKGQVAPVEPILFDLIDGRQQNYIPWAVEVQETYPVLWEVGIVEYYKQFLPFIHTKKCLVVKFEDLVGPLGGGLEGVQLANIQQIAAHVGIKVDARQSKLIAEGLFGNSGTFREGKIDGWKKYFTPALKEAFKKTPGANQLLIDLGYEKDALW